MAGTNPASGQRKMNGTTSLIKAILSALAAIVFAGGAGVLGWVVVELRGLRQCMTTHERRVGHTGMVERTSTYTKDMSELKDSMLELRYEVKELHKAFDRHHRTSGHP